MRPHLVRQATVFTVFTCLLLVALKAHAQLETADILDNALARYSAAAAGWADTFVDAASRLFWTLVVISMVWTFGLMAMRRADIGEFFSELVRFTVFTGFFWWALINGPDFATSIYASLRQIAGTATGLGQALQPSGVVDIGFAIFDKVLQGTTAWAPIDSAAGLVMAGIILIVLALVGVNLLLLLIAGWVLAYGGVFFLGFGGSRWTSEFAINYYKMVLGVGAQLMAMVLLVGIGKTFLDDYYRAMSGGVNLSEMAVMMIVVIVLFVLTNKIPALLASIVSGAGVGGAGIGQFGAGTAIGVAGMAAAAAATGGAALAAGASNIAGGGSAVMAAINKAAGNVAAGVDAMSSSVSTGAMGSSSGGGSSGGNSGGTAFAQAAGFGNVGSAPPSPSPNAKQGGTAAGGVEGARVVQLNSRSGASQGGPEPNDSSPKGPGSEGNGSSPVASASTAGAVGRIAIDAAANLARGAMEVGRSKVDGVRDRISETLGGQIAAAIRNQGSESRENSGATPTFEGDSVSASDEAGPGTESEVAEFVQRRNKST